MIHWYILFKQAFNDKVVITRCLVQYWQIFSSFLIFWCYFKSYKIWETRKIFPIMHSAPCDNNYVQTMWLLKGFNKIFLAKNRFWKLLDQLLMDYTSSIAPSTSNIMAKALNVSNCSMRACINLIQVKT